MGVRICSCAAMVISTLLMFVSLMDLSKYGARELVAAMPIVFSGGLIAFAIAGLKK